MNVIGVAQSGVNVEGKTESNVLQTLLAQRVPVKMAFGGRGLCATCHVYIVRGADGLTPRTKTDERTLDLLGEAEETSRLACQAKVLGDGVVVRLPKSLYIAWSADLKVLIGRRTTARVLHPITRRVLIEDGKVITKSTVDKLSQVDIDVKQMMTESQDAT